jgi:hypothetical protein
VFASSLPLSLAGAFSRPPAPSAWIGVALALVDVVIVVLLARRKTGEDIEGAAWARYARRRALHVPARWLGRARA